MNNSPLNIVITGTSRGIGLELTRRALKAGHQVLAVAREPQKSRELSELQSQFKDSLTTLALDVTHAESQAPLVKAVAGWDRIDVLINNAGVLLKGETTEDFLRSFHVNSVAPYLVTKALLPKLRPSRRPCVAHITSKMGSIDDNRSGGSVAYRASKTALNMINRCLTIENPWLTTLLLHPGWVQTDMGGAGAPTTVAESGEGLWRVILEASPEQSGHFLDFRGQSIPW